MDVAILTLKTPFQIHKDGSVKTIKEVPKNALELIEEGCTWLVLKKEAQQVIAKWSAERIQKVLALRTQQGIKHDVGILSAALEAKGKSKEEKAPTK